MGDIKCLNHKKEQLTTPIRFSRITIMTDRTHKVTNPYSGQSAMLNDKELYYYVIVKNAEKDEDYKLMQKGLDKFSRLNPKAYMTLLD
jgi:hypothetical protein